MTKPQVLEIKRGKDQTKEEALAEFNSKSDFLSTAVRESFDIGLGDDFNFQSTMQVLEKTIQQIQSGDLSKIEEMYIQNYYYNYNIYSVLQLSYKCDILLQ